MTRRSISILVALSGATLALTPIAVADVLIDDFATGPYDYDSSPYKTFYNGYFYSRFYFQDGASVIGTHRMVLVAGAHSYPTNEDFDGTIGGGLAHAKGFPGYNPPYWEYDYGVREAVGSAFPWQFADMHADLRGYGVIRYHFGATSGNIRAQVSFSSPGRYYHDSGWFSVGNAATPSPSTYRYGFGRVRSRPK